MLPKNNEEFLKLRESLRRQSLLDQHTEVDLVESRKKDAKILLDDGEVEFGSDPHLSDLKKTLAGMERIRDCYELGSGARLVFASAVQRIRKLVSSLEEQRQPPSSSI